MEWQVVVGVVAGSVVGVAIGLLLARRFGERQRPGAWWWTPGRHDPTGTPAAAGIRTYRRSVIVNDQQAGLGRRSIDALRAGVVVLDTDDVPVLANPAARAMGLLRTGASPGTLAAHPVVRTLAGQVRRTGVRRELDLDLPRGEGRTTREPLGVQLRATSLGSGFVTVEAVDVTEAHRVARVRRDFVANVSHELKTPIGALQLLAEALLDATDQHAAGVVDPVGDVAAARRFAERIQHESTRLGRLVTELLELTRLQGAEPLPAPEPVPVDWVLAEVVDRTRTPASARRVAVDVVGRTGLTVYGSDTQIATAVTNLVENAIAYSPEETRVTVGVAADDDHVDIAVTDQGIGIARRDLDRVFERFYRADQARSRSTGGTGLGLAIVKHIATNHGGQVLVSSAPGSGSTFTLRLPARRPDAVAPPSAPDGIEAGQVGSD